MEDRTEFRWRALADEIGPAKVVFIRDAPVGLEGIVVIDNVACGPAIGGIRMAADVSVEEVARLARAMTFKNAAAGLAHGGGKGGIIGDPGMAPTQKEKLGGDERRRSGSSWPWNVQSHP
jgi:glutamate dehydrogenase (NAD(P)+)